MTRVKSDSCQMRYITYLLFGRVPLSNPFNLNRCGVGLRNHNKIHIIIGTIYLFYLFITLRSDPSIQDVVLLLSFINKKRKEDTLRFVFFV